MGHDRASTTSNGATRQISTPDQRLRVFVSSTVTELSAERHAVKEAIETLRLTPVMFDPGARSHPPAELYRSYLEQSDVFVGVYWQSYGWIAPGSEISELEDEFLLAGRLPRLIYVKEPAPDREEGLVGMLAAMERNGSTSYRVFSTTSELTELLLDDLAVLVTERFYATSRSELSGGTLTFLFADLEGSTAMVRRLGDAYIELLKRYHSIVNAEVGDHGGRTAATEGDGFFCVFSSPVDAIDTARDILVTMASDEWPAGERPLCRLGLHTGTATRTMEGYVGLDVHRASRVGSAANGGQVLVSATTAALLEEHVDRSGWRLIDLGEFNLEGIGTAERLYQVSMPEVASVKTAPRARARAIANLPASPRPIVGRVADVQGASEMLLRETVRMITITGPGGTGKTRLAVEIASRLGHEFPDGVVFVDLSAVRDRSRFLPAVARSLGVRESAERSVLEGLETVVGPSHLLLVLDNLEQILDAASDVGRLLEVLPNVRVLATSRSPLRLSWENEYPLSPLPVPGSTADATAIRHSDAVALFVERARAVRPDFVLAAENEKVVAEVTRRLDGLPLAIELAAARLRLFPVEVLLERLHDRLAVLDKSASDAPERHRTLRAAIQWSHDLLDETERVVFRRLAVFSGGWRLEAATEVCGDESLTEIEIIDVLEELVAKSLVVFSMDDRGHSRYRMLETLREFSLEKLAEAGEEAEYRQRHLGWVLSIAERVMEVLPTPAFIPFLDEMEMDRFNIREAVAWSIQSGERLDDALAICGYLPLFLDIRGFVAEGVSMTRRLVGMTQGNSPSRGMALAGLGWLEMLAGNPDASGEALATSVQMFRDMGDDDWLARSLAMQGMTTYNRDAYDESEEQFRESMRLCYENGLEWLADAWCVYGLAHVALARGQFPEALELLQQAEAASREMSMAWGIGHTNMSLGVLAFMTGDLDEAYSRLAESARVRRDLRDSRGVCDCLGMMALLASVGGDHPLAAVMLGAAEIAREASGQRPVPWIQPLLEQAQMSAQLALREDYEAKLDEGRRLSTEEAIDMALQKLRPLEGTAPSAPEISAPAS